MIKKKLKLEGIENIEIKLEDKEKGLTLSITGHLKLKILADRIMMRYIINI